MASRSRRGVRGGRSSERSALTATNYSIDAEALFTAPGTTREFRVYLGGLVHDFVTGTLPSGCNFFDGARSCAEPTSISGYGPFTVWRSDGNILTRQAFACTTAAGSLASDPYDEFGLHILDGPDNVAANHCYGTASSLGFQDMGRIYTVFNREDGAYWERGVTSAWPESSPTGGSSYSNTVGYLMMR